MCKINGQSLFKWMFATPIAVKDEAKRRSNKKASTEIAEVAQKLPEHSDGDEISQTASTAKINNKTNKNQTLSSLRIPLQSSNVGASVSSGTSALGLNLGG